MASVLAIYQDCTLYCKNVFYIDYTERDTLNGSSTVPGFLLHLLCLRTVELSFIVSRSSSYLHFPVNVVLTRLERRRQNSVLILLAGFKLEKSVK